MTLPAYHPMARQNEQVLGREGERGGIDVVVEFPEGVDEEEARREEEMEALYQVRLARRRENEEREERRRLRREARERGDTVAMREIAARTRASANSNAGRTVEELRAEHDRIKKERARAVSSVSYADLGIARHDGTRLRAGSMESEREGLLAEAASMGNDGYHRRDRSGSSIQSVDSTSDFPSPALTRSRGNSRAESPLRRISTSNTQYDEASTRSEGRAGSSPEMIEHDDIPPSSPPEYENISLDNPHDLGTVLEPPPDYSSPVLGRGEHRGPFDGTASQSRPSSIDQIPVSRPASTVQSQAEDPVISHNSSRASGLSPHLPSLRLSSLPSIQVDPGSPASQTVEERHNNHNE
jgi:hypothetical protein